MHLEAKTPEECDFLITALGAYFGVWIELEKNTVDDADEQDKIKNDIQEIAYIIQRINQYQEAYPETKDNNFYIELKKHEVDHLLQSFYIFSRLKEDSLTPEQECLINKYKDLSNEYLEDFGRELYDEEFVRGLFEEYKNELKAYCEDTIRQHIEHGNEEVYVFSIQAFPGHHYQLVTLNTIKSLFHMLGENALKEAATYGYKSEAYNPACFNVGGRSSQAYENIESKIEQLHTRFYSLTDEYSDHSFKEGTCEYDNIKAMEKLAYDLFTKNSIDVLNQIDYSDLNQADNFCAILASHGFSEDEFYECAKQTIPPEKFSLIFPNAGRVEEDYIDFDKSSAEDIVTYLINYIKDFRMGTVPEGRYYTDIKVYEYIDKLSQYELLIDDKILLILEDIVNASKPNPDNPQEKHFINMFSKEGILSGDLLDVLSKSTKFLETTQQRLIEIYKKVIIGMVPSNMHPTFIHRDLALAIFRTDPDKYPEIEYDMETSYVINVDDYTK